MTSIWQPMRCRALAQPDKKQISVVRTMLDLLAVEATTKTNDLDTLFSKLRSLASTIVPCPAPEDGTEAPLYPLNQADIDSLQEAINNQEKQHREDDYKDFFDEAKLRPLAHKCMVLWNKVEGFESAPFEDVSEADRIKKRARFEATVSKRRDAEEKKRVAMAQKEEDAVRREEFKKAIAAPVQAGIMTVEDSSIPDAPPLGFIDYTNIPLVGLEEDEEEEAAPPTALTYYHDFERALEVWSFLVSVPEPIKLSQFSFSSFVTAVTTPNETHLIESIFSALVQTGVRGSPNIPSPKQVEQQMRGNPWFKRALQFFDIASGKKQERERQQKAKALAKKRQREEIEEVDDSDDDEEASEDESDESEDDDESSSVEVEVEEVEEVKKDEDVSKVAEVEEVEEEPTIAGFDAELKSLHDELRRLGRLALWVNLSIGERLVFLKFLVECLLEAPSVVAAADKVDKEAHAQVLAFEKRVKELRDETDKKLKKLVKTIMTTTPQADTPNTIEEPTETRESVVADLKENIHKELVKMVKKSESGEVGAKIVPIGQDRYRRLYWRFPLDSGVYVQTTTETRPFVLAPRPAKVAMLLDDEDDDPKQKKKADGEKEEEEKPQFQTWGRICAEHLPAFLATLDKRGTREAHLKAQLEPLVTHLSNLAAPPTPSVVTRSRAVYGGYRNSFMEI